MWYFLNWHFKSNIGRSKIFNRVLSRLIGWRVVLISFCNLFCIFPSFEIISTNYSYHQIENSLKTHNKGTSLVVWWLRLCLPVQKVRAGFLVRQLRSHMPSRPKKPEYKQLKQYCNKLNEDFKMSHIKKKSSKIRSMDTQVPYNIKWHSIIGPPYLWLQNLQMLED